MINNEEIIKHIQHHVMELSNIDSLDEETLQEKKNYLNLCLNYLIEPKPTDIKIEVELDEQIKFYEQNIEQTEEYLNIIFEEENLLNQSIKNCERKIKYTKKRIETDRKRLSVLMKVKLKRKALDE